MRTISLLGLSISCILFGTQASAADCTELGKHLETCTPFTCDKQVSGKQQKIEHRVLGSIEGKCQYQTQMPDGRTLECRFDEGTRRSVAQFISIAETKTPPPPTIVNPIMTALRAGQCRTISISTTTIPPPAPKARSANR